MSETVAVAGATGYLGRHVCLALAEQGFSVRALVRSEAAARRPGNFGAPALDGIVTDFTLVDYERPETVDGVFVGVDRVVSTLGVTRQKASPWDIDFLGNLRLFGYLLFHGRFATSHSLGENSTRQCRKKQHE